MQVLLDGARGRIDMSTRLLHSFGRNTRENFFCGGSILVAGQYDGTVPILSLRTPQGILLTRGKVGSFGEKCFAKSFQSGYRRGFVSNDARNHSCAVISCKHQCTKLDILLFDSGLPTGSQWIRTSTHRTGRNFPLRIFGIFRYSRVWEDQW